MKFYMYFFVEYKDKVVILITLNIVDLSLQDQNESAAILKIKETMQEEAKRFEKDVPPDHPDYFMP